MRRLYQRNPHLPEDIGPVEMARVFLPGGRVEAFSDAKEALRFYYAIPSSQRAAFRAAGDKTPVRSHDFVR